MMSYTTLPMIGRTVIALLVGVIAGCGGDGPADFAESTPRATEVATDGAGAGAGPAAPGARYPAAADTAMQVDRAIFESTLDRARLERVDTLPLGERVVALGRWFVGSDYVPGTLEVSPERLVVNLREFDCVTYVESMLAMARVLGRPAEEATFNAYLDELRTIRYRNGSIDGYPSRLHYFSDWIGENDRRGIVEDVTKELGGLPLDEQIDFMSTNRESYAALGAPGTLEQIRAQEADLSARALAYVPEGRIPSVAQWIHNGDVIAATSAIEGLDIAHTGLAIWIDDRLHLMHAPLVGSSVEISELPLAERILGISGQDGIMVARPVE